MTSRKLTGLSLLVFALGGCASAPPVRTQAYATLRSDRLFEYEFPTVWAGVENALRGYKVLERDPDEVTPPELKKLTERSLRTDWIYTQSRDKYQEYKVNDSPRKKYLQTRVKHRLRASRVLGGTQVQVETEEEIEKLGSDGMPLGYERADAPDSSRAQELIEKVNLAILSSSP